MNIMLVLNLFRKMSTLACKPKGVVVLFSVAFPFIVYLTELIESDQYH